MTASTRTMLLRVDRINGVAGQFALVARVQYPGEEPRIVEFVGSRYGGPVLMVTDAGHCWVDEPDRFGQFGKDWVRRFFS